MADDTQMLFIRPKNCHYCEHGYYGLAHAVQYAYSKGMWNITDLNADQANKVPVYEAINSKDPLSIYGFGHGEETRFTGDAEEDIFTISDCSILSGKLIYLLSCLTGNLLGPEIIRQGAIGYVGYNISWTWIADTEGGEFTYPDPYNDPYALCFWESANEFWMAMVDGKEFHEALQAMIDRYNAWIDYWFYDNPEDPFSQECIMWLAHDRDGLVALDNCTTYEDQITCETRGCQWINASCQSQLPQQKGLTSSIVPLIPLIALVGIAFIAMRK